MDLRAIILFSFLLFSTVQGLMFELQPNGRKCLREEVQKDVLVTGEYEVSEVPGQRTDVKVSLNLERKQEMGKKLILNLDVIFLF